MQSRDGHHRERSFSEVRPRVGKGRLTLAEWKERGEGEQLWLWGGEGVSKGEASSCKERSEARTERERE